MNTVCKRIQFHYYPFAVKLDRGVGSCNILSDFPNKVCIPNETEDHETEYPSQKNKKYKV